MTQKHKIKKLKKKDIKKMLKKSEAKTEKRIEKALKTQKEKYKKQLERALKGHDEVQSELKIMPREETYFSTEDTSMTKNQAANSIQWG